MYLSRWIRIPSRPLAAAAAAAAVSAPFSSSPPESRNPLKVGSTLQEVRRFSASDVAAYSAVSGDQNPVHSDPDFARRIAGFERGSIVHGMLVASLFPAVIASHFPGAVYVSQNLQFKLPVYIDDEVVAEIQAIHLREHKTRFIVKFTTKCFLEQKNLAVDGEAMAILPTLIPIK